MDNESSRELDCIIMNEKHWSNWHVWSGDVEVKTCNTYMSIRYGNRGDIKICPTHTFKPNPTPLYWTPLLCLLLHMTRQVPTCIILMYKCPIHRRH